MLSTAAILNLFSVRYIGRIASLFASALAALWFSTLVRSDGIFDLLGATLCLLTPVCRQFAQRFSDDIRLDLDGAVCYLLAIRTKEFALGTIVLLFGPRAPSTQLSKHGKGAVTVRRVVTVYAVRYAQLLVTAPPSPWTVPTPFAGEIFGPPCNFIS